MIQEIIQYLEHKIEADYALASYYFGVGTLEDWSKIQCAEELKYIEYLKSLIKDDGDLKPCPFCAFVPDLNDPDCLYPINREKTVYNLVCYEAGGGCGAHVLGDSNEDCIARWNKRT